MKTFLTQDLRKNINVLSINTLVSFTFCMKTYKRVRMFTKRLNYPRIPSVYKRGSHAGALSATNDLKGRHRNWGRE